MHAKNGLTSIGLEPQGALAPRAYGWILRTRATLELPGNDEDGTATFRAQHCGVIANAVAGNLIVVEVHTTEAGNLHKRIIYRCITTRTAEITPRNSPFEIRPRVKPVLQN